MKTKIFKAFTLIELLIVIVIIGILATALIPRITGVQDKARYARVQKELRDFRAAVFMAESNTNKTLYEIVGDWDVAHPACYDGSNVILTDWRSLAQNHPCRTEWIAALRKIEVAAGMASGSLANMETDPWGSPYGLDPNEGEVLGSFDKCDRSDLLYSGGPDGNIFTLHAGLQAGTMGFIIPFMGCPGAY